MENCLNPKDGSDNPYLKPYLFKRELDGNYFRLIAKKHPNFVVCYFCLTPKEANGKMCCSEECNVQLTYRSGHKIIRQVILERDNRTCQICGVREESLVKSLNLLKKVSKKLWRLKLQELKIPDKRIDNYMDVDHILPISKGGGAGYVGDIRTNLRVVCIYCHFHKTQAENDEENFKHSRSKTED